MSITLPNNPAFQNVNLSNVTQAAQGMSGGNTPGGGAVSNYGGGGNPSTSLNLSGQTSQMGQNFANYGQKVGQVPITGPSGQNSGGGQPQISPGSYTPQNLTQDQRQALWEHFGHKGIAPLGYGGENPQQQFIAPPPPMFPRFVPSFTPPPAPVPSATMTPQGVSGATSPLSSTSIGGGVSGQAFQALTQAGQATKGLQLPGLAQSVISALTSGAGTIGKDVAGALGTFAPQFQTGQAPQSQAQTQKPQVQGYHPEADTGGATPVFSGLERAFQESIGPALQSAGLVTGAKGLIKGGIGVANALKGGLGEGADLGAALKKGIGGLFSGLAVPLGNSDKYMGPTGTEANYNRQTRALTTPQGQKTDMATMENLGGNITDQKQVQQLVSSVLTGQGKQSDVVASLASPQGLQTVSKMINTAVKQGDMNTVNRLASIHNDIQQQLDFITRIGQIVTALSAGFGSQNQPGVTEARTPMVQQGIGQSLTSSQSPNAPIGQQPGSEIPYLPTNLQTASPAQQQKPPLDWMGNGYASDPLINLVQSGQLPYYNIQNNQPGRLPQYSLPSDSWKQPMRQVPHRLG